MPSIQWIKIIYLPGMNITHYCDHFRNKPVRIRWIVFPSFSQFWNCQLSSTAVILFKMHDHCFFQFRSLTHPEGINLLAKQPQMDKKRYGVYVFKTGSLLSARLWQIKWKEKQTQWQKRTFWGSGLWDDSPVLVNILGILCNLLQATTHLKPSLLFSLISIPVCPPLARS